MTDFAVLISKNLNYKPTQVQAAIELLDAGNTVPFISRYRKEMTGALDEEQIRLIQSELDRLRVLEDRRVTVLASITEQEKMTPELEEKIKAAETVTALEDLYAPYKPKRRTRASIAREKGLAPLADVLLMQPRAGRKPDEEAQQYLNEQVLTVEDALSGARDIVAEMISDHADVRRLTREKSLAYGIMRAEKIDDAEDQKQVYSVYYEFEARVDKIRPHQVLALDRGETEKVLRVGVETAEKDWQNAIHSQFRPDGSSPWGEHLETAIEDSANRLLLPAIERDVRRELTARAQLHAINVFASNTRALLNQPPLKGHTVIGLDPGFRTGCKFAVVSPTGKLLDTGTIYPHEPQKKWNEALDSLRAMVKKHHVTLVSIGNGTASRESEQLIAELIKDLPGVQYMITNEAGASVYSASPLARQEMPDLDVSIRGAASIARRVQDPLAELVKIDPQSIGVGMYQHDVDQTLLKHTLDGVVEDVVNRVGVDVNTASPALLAYAAGIGPKLAEKVVAYRDEKGVFTNRAQLRDVPGLGPKAYEQCAGFTRVLDGDEPLDASAIHPESYGFAKATLERAGISTQTDPKLREPALRQLLIKTQLKEIAADLGCGALTLRDIFEQLVRPGRDPRQDAPPPILRTDVLKMEDLAEGMRLKGTVRNVVDFGAFVDIGVKQDGLLHRTQMTFGTVLQVADIIEVEILKVEKDRGRISLKLV